MRADSRSSLPPRKRKGDHGQLCRAAGVVVADCAPLHLRSAAVACIGLAMLDADWKQQRLHVLDFEGSAESGVVEFGAVSLYAGRIEAVATATCAPEGRVSRPEVAVHGLDAAELAREQSFRLRWGEFVQLRRSGLFGAHNRHAEDGFLRAVWPLPPPVPAFDGTAAQLNTWGPWVDTLGLYRALYPLLEDYSLSALVRLFLDDEQVQQSARQYCPEGRRRSHCALYDALCSALLLLRLELEDGLAGRMSLGWMLRLSSGDSGQQELF